MSKRWLVAVMVASMLLLAGCATGKTNQGGQTPATQSANGQSGGTHGRSMSSQQRQQLQQDFRSGKVVSLASGHLTVAVDGGPDQGKNETYNLTASTRVTRDRTVVSTGAQVPDLGSLGLKAGYYVVLRVNNGNVVSLQFSSNGSRPAQMGRFQPDSGKVVSLTGSTVTVAVDSGPDQGKNETFKLTAATRVTRDGTVVSTSGKVPDLGTLGLKSGYYVILAVNNGSVVNLLFNSAGGKPQMPQFRSRPTQGANQGTGSAQSQ